MRVDRSKGPRWIVRTVGGSPRYLTTGARMAGWSLDRNRAAKFRSADAAFAAADLLDGALIVQRA